jgi:hypothetical protein
MMNKTWAVLTVVLLASTLCFAGDKDLSKQYENTNSPFRLHGRLSMYCGNPCFRIWIIGTKRLLGVRGGDLEPASMPPDLQAFFHTNASLRVYADFNVTPLTIYKKGHMQIVQIDSAKNLVIYSGEKFLKKMKELVPNNAVEATRQ